MTIEAQSGQTCFGHSKQTFTNKIVEVIILFFIFIFFITFAMKLTFKSLLLHIQYMYSYSQKYFAFLKYIKF